MAYMFRSSRFAARHLAAATAVMSFAALPALAQVNAGAAQGSAAPTLQTIAYSSSGSGQNPFGGEDIDGQSLASSPNGTIKTVAPQYGGGYGGGHYHPYNDNSRWSHLAFEVGGGFTAPIGNNVNGGFTSLIGDGQNYGTTTWGGNIIAGAGWSFSKRFTLLGEFSYNSNKIPGRTLSAVYDTGGFADAGISQLGGNVHTYGITAEPMFYYFQSDKHKYAGYVIGGGGFYHKTTSFTTPIEACDYYGYCGYENVNVQSFSDNAGGFNLGTGVTFKPLGEYSQLKFFAEARYMFVATPREEANSSELHTGTEELIPVTFGIRF